MDEKRERFLRIAEQRTNKAIKIIRLIGNTSDRKNYTYTEEEVNKIFKVLEQELKEARVRFKKIDNDKFKLK
jgi:DNA polymerase IIIc chi subunit